MRKTITDYAAAKRRLAFVDYFARSGDPHEAMKALWRATTWGLVRDFFQQPSPVVRAFTEERQANG